MIVRMRIVYFSRQFNRGGLAILDSLIESQRFDVVALVVPPIPSSQRALRRLNHPLTAWWEKLRYWSVCALTGARRLRFEDSIHQRARGVGIPVLEIPSLKDEKKWRLLKGYEPDLLVLGGGWPELLPSGVIAIAPLGAISAHPSLLPAYRGSDVHRWQIRDGVSVSGTTIHYLDSNFDTGPILGQVEVGVLPDDTPQDLFRRISQVAGPLMLSVLDRIARSAPGRVKVAPQPDSGSESLPKWPWGNADFLTIDPRVSARELERFVRACAQESFNYDGPWIRIGSQQFIVRICEVGPRVAGARPGVVVLRDGWPVLQCGDEAVVLRQLQKRGPAAMSFRSVSGRSLARREIRQPN